MLFILHTLGLPSTMRESDEVVKKFETYSKFGAITVDESWEFENPVHMIMLVATYVNVHCC